MTATVDLDEVVSFRASISSLREQASSSSLPAFVAVDWGLCQAMGKVDMPQPVRVRGQVGIAVQSIFTCSFALPRQP